MSKIQRIIFLMCTWVALTGNSFAFAPDNGWWWNPAESGSGYAIERQGSSIFMAAFLYETSGAATWYASLLTLQPDGSYKGDMTRYVGGKSLLGLYKAPTSNTIVATARASFEFNDSGSLTISFLNGAPSRTIAINRFAFATPIFEPSRGSFQNGWWWNDQESGTGYFIEVQGTKAFIASFMYDTAGQPTWYASVANLSGTNLLSGPVDMFSNGQSLGGNYKAPTVNSGAAGNMSYGFISNSVGSMTLPNNGRVAIKRFIFDPIVVSNHAPVPNAGPDQTVTVGDTVYLNGSATDDDNDPLNYLWNFLNRPSGSTTTLYGWQTSRPYFVADFPGIYRFGLLADDGKVSNAGSVVTINAISKAVPSNIAPVANAGVNQSVTTGARVTLNGSASNDANGDVLTYNWFFVTKPSGSSAILTGTSTVLPSFTADVAGTYVIGLTVNDGKVSSLQSSVTITVNQANIAPIANAGTNQSVFVGDLTYLDGTKSSDANGDNLSYNWTFSAPFGTSSLMYGANSSKPYFTPDISGDYVFTLIVNDGRLNSQPSSAKITATYKSIIGAPDCSGLYCGSVNNNLFNGGGIGIWKYKNNLPSNAKVDLNINGVSSGKSVTLLFSNGTDSSITAIPSNGTLATTLPPAITKDNSEGFSTENVAHSNHLNRTQELKKLDIVEKKLVTQNITNHPNAPAPQQPAINMALGTTRIWNDNDNSSSPIPYLTSAQLICPLASGRNLIFWVDNNSLKSGQLTASIINDFANPFCGVNGAASKLNTLIGDFWGSHNLKTHITDSPLQDVNIVIIDAPASSGWAGYAAIKDNFLKSAYTWSTNSNEAVAFFIKASLITKPSPYMQSALVHEATHMINYYQQSIKSTLGADYDTWLEETSAMMGEDIVSPAFVKNTDGSAYNPIKSSRIPAYIKTGGANSLINWTTLDTGDYGMGGSFGAFLNRRYGLSIFKQMINCKKPSYNCIDNLIKANGGTGFDDEFSAFGSSIFSLLPSTGIPTKYGYPAKTDGGIDLLPIDLSGFSSIKPASPTSLGSSFTATTHTYQSDIVGFGKTSYVRNGIILPANTTLTVIIK